MTMMPWLGWVVAACAALGAVLLYRRMVAEQETVQRLRAYKEDAEAEIAELRETRERVLDSARLAASGRLFLGAAHDIAEPLARVGTDLDAARSDLQEYRNLVSAYDAAVQYCLQPVELILGADKDSLEKLVKHVEAARQRLFSARAAMEKSVAFAECARLLDGAGSEVGRIDALVRALDALSDVAGGNSDSVDIHAALEDVLAVATTQAQGNVVVQRRFGVPLYVAGVPGQIRQVFSHLVTNAIEAMGGRGNLLIQTRQGDGGAAEISISDSGQGIGDKVLPQVFDAFFTTHPDTGALGLGLFEARRIVGQHGGSIAVTSSSSEGTTVHLVLPVRRPVVIVDAIAQTA